LNRTRRRLEQEQNGSFQSHPIPARLHYCIPAVVGLVVVVVVVVVVDDDLFVTAYVVA